ncbi:hypothetical protein L596_024304 [Steinernema carpocapsae]|uniref:Uncharacterized protein n=1 Tax=Steinernema carpocapsae TaxID=34508 RepID=A0A4U5MGD0_STECR|nr:hypothetical protein L596_024304 [Steinernema carpocapsae]
MHPQPTANSSSTVPNLQFWTPRCCDLRRLERHTPRPRLLCPPTTTFFSSCVTFCLPVPLVVSHFPLPLSDP